MSNLASVLARVAPFPPRSALLEPFLSSPKSFVMVSNFKFDKHQILSHANERLRIVVRFVTLEHYLSNYKPGHITGEFDRAEPGRVRPRDLFARASLVTRKTSNNLF